MKLKRHFRLLWIAALAVFATLALSAPASAKRHLSLGTATYAANVAAADYAASPPVSQQYIGGNCVKHSRLKATCVVTTYARATPAVYSGYYGQFCAAFVDVWALSWSYRYRVLYNIHYDTGACWPDKRHAAVPSAPVSQQPSAPQWQWNWVYSQYNQAPWLY